MMMGLKMKLIVISDLHLDINREIPFYLEQQDIFTIVCGDISEDTSEAAEWIKNNVNNGVFVEGNHIGYKNKESLQSILEYFSARFPLDYKVSHLNNSYKTVDDVVFVGSILWTDFDLYGKQNRDVAIRTATKEIKDFNCTYFNSNHDNKRFFSPDNAIDLFHESVNYIKNICEKFHDKKIVVVTHHAPSIKSIPSDYKNDICSTAFASNLDDFILAHPNIKLWCHGHIHRAFDYYIGNCRVVCNPRGYMDDNEETGFNKYKIIEI